ncbi:putative siderophore biosynthesis enzyme [Halenospora varia]|nr:putative siderophore biosynthesis enzyme [Halenospora varia]
MHSSFYILALAAVAAAKTDLSGCTSSSTKNQWGEASMIYWVPGTGEICAFLDCGGGRAPPKTTVPGCAAYEGTATYSPSYMTGQHAVGASTATSTSKPATTTSTTDTSALITPGTKGPASTLSTPTGTSVVISSSVSSGPESAITSAATTSVTSLVTSTTSGSGSSGVAPGNSTSTSSAGVATTSPNAGSMNSVHGILGVVAAGFALFL